MLQKLKLCGEIFFPQYFQMDQNYLDNVINLFSMDNVSAIFGQDVTLCTQARQPQPNHFCLCCCGRSHTVAFVHNKLFVLLAWRACVCRVASRRVAKAFAKWTESFAFPSLAWLLQAVVFGLFLRFPQIMQKKNIVLLSLRRRLFWRCFLYYANPNA